MSKKNRERMELTSVGSEKENKEKTGGLKSLIGEHRLLAFGIIAFLSMGVIGAGLGYMEDDARREMARQKHNRLAAKDAGWLAQVNPFMPASMPTPATQLSKEYVYAGARMLAVEDAAASPFLPADLAVWRPSDGTWYVLGGPGSQGFQQQWGMSGDVPVQGDYDGDGKADIAIYRPSTNYWWISPSSGASHYALPLGAAGDVTVPGDYDGDGKTDQAVFHQSAGYGYWQIRQSTTQNTTNIQFGLSTDIAAPADYDGDGKIDIAVWRNSTATFWLLKSSDGTWESSTFGWNGDTPVSADYDGDGKADYALRHGDTWVIRQTSDAQIVTVTWYTGGYAAVPHDYDADGKVDIAVWKPAGKSNGDWYIRQSSHLGQYNELLQVHWGMTGDIPVQALYRR